MSNKVILSLVTANKMANYVKNKMKSSKESIIKFDDIPVSYYSKNKFTNGKITEANLIDKTFKVTYLDNNDWQTPISINMKNITIKKDNVMQQGGNPDITKDNQAIINDAIDTVLDVDIDTESDNVSNNETSMEFNLSTDLVLP